MGVSASASVLPMNTQDTFRMDVSRGVSEAVGEGKRKEGAHCMPRAAVLSVVR